MSKKTDRKNKTNLVVQWPTAPYFTIIDDLFPLQPEVKKITLRVRLAKEIEAGRIAEIGTKTGAQGRPKKVYAFTPVPQTTLDLARANRITLVEHSQLKKLGAIPPVIPVFTPRLTPPVVV
jgi:hypothetical protein